MPETSASGKARVVRVVPDVTAVHKEFDYIVPEVLTDSVRVGTLVRVPLHGRRVGGWVVDDDVEPPGGVALRPLAGVRGWGPPPAVVALARWAAWRWAGPLSSLLGTASPLLAVRSLPPTPPPTALQAGAPGGPVAEALAGGPAVLRLPPAADRLRGITAASDLLVGAPPESGVLILAPSQREAADLAGRLRRAGRPVALLPQEWSRARAGGCVVIGARAAAFAPLPRLGGGRDPRRP